MYDAIQQRITDYDREILRKLTAMQPEEFREQPTPKVPRPLSEITAAGLGAPSTGSTAPIHAANRESSLGGGALLIPLPLWKGDSSRPVSLPAHLLYTIPPRLWPTGAGRGPPLTPTPASHLPLSADEVAQFWGSFRGSP
jgi:hypothetical protein